MSSQVPAKKLGDAILQSVEHGGFPQDEDVASASVPSSALPKLLEVVSKAKENTKARGSSLILLDVANSHRMRYDRYPAKPRPMSMGG